MAAISAPIASGALRVYGAPKSNISCFLRRWDILGRGRLGRHYRATEKRSLIWEPLSPAFEASQAGAILREASTLEELSSSFVDNSDG